MQQTTNNNNCCCCCSALISVTEAGFHFNSPSILSLSLYYFLSPPAGESFAGESVTATPAAVLSYRQLSSFRISCSFVSPSILPAFSLYLSNGTVRALSLSPLLLVLSVCRRKLRLTVFADSREPRRPSGHWATGHRPPTATSTPALPECRNAKMPKYRNAMQQKQFAFVFPRVRTRSRVCVTSFLPFCLSVTSSQHIHIPPCSLSAPVRSSFFLTFFL